MVDRGEKIPFAERKRLARVHIEDFKQETRRKLHGKSNSVIQLLILVLIAVIFIQSSGMIDRMNKLLNESSDNIHEIYDDGAVIKAYRTGNTDKLDEKDTFVYEKLIEVIDECITDDMTDYDKEKAIYDWQVGWTHYNNENLNPISVGSNETHTPYGVFRSHSAICVGNATTFKLFMDALNIPCMIIHSTEYGEHAWNVVQLDNEWYHVDVTFDGTNTTEPRYSSFNVPDSIKDDGGWPWDHELIPAANGTKYSYIYMSAISLDDIYDIPMALKQKSESETGDLYFKLKDSTGFSRYVAEYIGESIPIVNGDIYFDSSYAMNGEIVYRYCIEHYSDIAEGKIPDDILQRINSAVDEALYAETLQETEPSDDEGEDYSDYDGSAYYEKLNGTDSAIARG